MNKAALAIQQRMEQQEGEAFIDPITLSVIAGVLSILFNAFRIYFLFKDRSKSAGEVIHENCYYETSRVRKIIRRAVRRRLSRADYAERGNALCRAILDYGKTANIDELQDMYDGKDDDGMWQEL
jgi:hypothetical protein